AGGGGWRGGGCRGVWGRGGGGQCPARPAKGTSHPNSARRRPVPPSRADGTRSSRRPPLRGATSVRRRRRRKKVRPLRRKGARAERGCRGQRLRAPCPIRSVRIRSSTGRCRRRRNRRRRLRAKSAPPLSTTPCSTRRLKTL